LLEREDKEKGWNLTFLSGQADKYS
jgi:hypothetical protein